MSDLSDLFGPPISIYTRAEAIEDGSLVDVTETAREAGFTVPVAITAAAWADCVAWDDDDTKRHNTPQDEAGRLWDVLWMTRHACGRGSNSDRVAVQLYRVPRTGTGHKARLTELQCLIGPGDDAEPVITITLPDED